MVCYVIHVTATVSYSRTARARVLKQLEHPKLVNMKFLNIVLQATGTTMHVEVWNMHVCVTMHCNATTAVHALDL